jgi:hypothetical protein
MIVVSDVEHSNILFRVFEDLYDMSVRSQVIQMQYESPIPRIKEETNDSLNCTENKKSISK